MVVSLAADDTTSNVFLMSMGTRGLTEEEQQLWTLVSSAWGKALRTVDEALQTGSQLSSAEFAVLSMLSASENQTMRLRELCHALRWDRSRVSHQVTRMQRRGLVAKDPSPGDGRGVLVSATDDGVKRVAAATPEHAKVVRRVVLEPLKDEGAAQVLETICRAILQMKAGSRK